ncbi:MAG: sulfotransferase domain-containing protein [Vicinamibacterales bacterium]
MDGLLSMLHRTGNLVWVASFPKSGNTWVRMFIATYLAACDRTDLALMKEYSGSESALCDFAQVAGKPIEDLTREDIAAQRDAVQEHLANVFNRHVVKTHCARLDLALRPLIVSRLTRAGVYVVRNPLDIVDSLADHANMSLDAAIGWMNEPSHRLRGTLTHAAQYAGTWSHHVRTWTQHQEFPLLVMRYEDVKADPVHQFTRLVRFLEWDYDAERLRRAVELTSFEALKRAEDLGGFEETSPMARSARFFRHGRAGRFKEVLSVEQVARVIRDHGEMMRMVGYAAQGDTAEEDTAEGDTAEGHTPDGSANG